jgi:predicted lipoprotein with Yx(FWY)xxD motif
MTDTTTRNRRSASAIAAIAFLMAACGSAGAGSTPTAGAVATQSPASPAATAPAASGPAASAPGASEAAEAYEVELGDKASLGKFLTGEDGKTLYMFTPDADGKSACNTGCVDSWPPFTLDDGETVKGGDGVTGAFATITRDDGGKQVTYAGHPLYYFSGDQAKGDTNGQGLNGKWYVLGADGNPIKGSASSGYRNY